MMYASSYRLAKKCTFDTMSIPGHLFALFILVVCSAVSTCAQSVGCYVTLGVSSPQMFYQKETGSTGTPTRFFSNVSYNTTCPTGASTSAQYAAFLGNTTSPGTVCWAQRKAGAATAPNPNPNNAGEYNLNGFLASYSIRQCPIDDYIPLIAVVLAGIGCISFRRKLT